MLSDTSDTARKNILTPSDPEEIDSCNYEGKINFQTLNPLPKRSFMQKTWVGVQKIRGVKDFS
jgi:hypothetical protein